VIDISAAQAQNPQGLHPERLNPWSVGERNKAEGQESAQRPLDAASLEAWVKTRLDWQQECLDTLVSGAGVSGGGDRAVRDTLRLYDDAVAALGMAGSQAALLDSVYPEKEVRDKARELTQRVAEAGTALSLNQQVFRALEALNLTGVDPATEHYVTQTLLNYRLAGVDKDEATRARVRELSDQAVELSLTFGKNVQENVNRVEVSSVAELEGLPEDFIKNHPPDEKGIITLTTDYPDMQPVMTFAHSEELRLRMFLAYWQRQTR
jgi:thimet oligopeptidase